MKNYIDKIKMFAITHKIITTIIVVVVFGVGYGGYKKITSPAGVARYVTSKVTIGTIVSSITDSGQVSALNQITINPTVSGALVSVNVKSGDVVKKGKTLFVIDNTNAQKTVRDAEISLQNANLALKKLQLQSSSTNLNTALSTSYANGFNSVTSTIYDLNSVLSGLNTILLTKSDLSDNAVRAQGNIVLGYRNDAVTAYYDAQTAFQKNNNNYTPLSNNSSISDIKNIIQETYNTSVLLSDALKSTQTLVDYMAQNSNNASQFTSDQTTISTYANTINSDSTALLGDQTTISNNEQAFPSNDLSTQSAQITITQAQNSLLDAQQNLANYYITAPFDGVIASVPIIAGDNVSSGTTLGTIITSSEIANVSLNEVDVAKISLGEKATLTFDAIPNLTIAGQVVQIDSIGTVSSGVVNYNVQISFNATNNGGVKPGMSVNAAIITNVKQNVLMVPNGAIKTTGGVSYVQTFAEPLPTALPGVQGSPSTTPPKSQVVVTGISNDTSTEIVSGLNAGDIIVTKTIASTTAPTTTATTTPSILGGSTGGRGGGIGGAVRIGG